MIATNKQKETGLERLGRRHASNLGDLWRRLQFTEGGNARLAHTAGLLLGMSSADAERAAFLANDLCERLDYLDAYGGDLDMEVGDGARVSVPAYRVVLGDDGTLGGFTLAWYRAVLPAEYATARDAFPFADGFVYREWRDELCRQNHWLAALETTKYYWPNGTGPSYEGQRMELHAQQYRYSFNGGLLAHWAGNVMAVRLNDSHPWSIHT